METGTSRQAARELIARTSAELVSLEEKLGLNEKKKRLALLCDKLERGEETAEKLAGEIRDVL